MVLMARFTLCGVAVALAATTSTLLAPGRAIPPLSRPGLKPSPIPDCAWLVKSNTTVSNWALPNAATTYWSHAYKLKPGEQLEVWADFPGRDRRATRFFSYQNYDVYGVSVDTLFDAQIKPDQPGQLNPYTPGGAKNPIYGRYKIVISNRGGEPMHSNQMRAYPGTPGASSDPGRKVPYGVLMLRYYLPPDQNINTDKFGPGDGPNAGAGGQGGVALPTLIHVDKNNKRTPISPCTPDVRADYALTADPGRLALPLLFYQKNGPVFVRPSETQGVYPNDANAYLAAQAIYEPGYALLLEGRVPRTPNTLAGEAPGSPSQQLRYWSLCVNENAYPIPGTTPNGCLDDQDVLHGRNRQGDRFLALVVLRSEYLKQFTPEERQELRQAGVFVLDWFTEDPLNLAATPTTSPITLLLRNVPSGRQRDLFLRQASNVKPGSGPRVAKTIMGEYGVTITRLPFRSILHEVRRRRP